MCMIRKVVQLNGWGKVLKEIYLYILINMISRLESQAGLKSFDIMPFVMNNNSINEGYIYLRYTAVVNGKLLTMNNQWLNISEYPQSFLEYSKIYGNGGSEVYR